MHYNRMCGLNSQLEILLLCEFPRLSDYAFQCTRFLIHKFTCCISSLQQRPIMAIVYKCIIFLSLCFLQSEAAGRTFLKDHLQRPDARKGSTEHNVICNKPKMTQLLLGLFPLFNIVSFTNDVCTAASDATMMGTCYTSTECSDLGGSKDGNCASGFGVCCVFITSCSSTGGTNTINRVMNYSAPRLNGQRLSNHFLAVKAGYPITRANLM